MDVGSEVGKAEMVVVNQPIVIPRRDYRSPPSFASIVLVIITPSSNDKCCPHPSGEGRGGTLTAVAGVLVVEPTSLRGGEGLAAGLLCTVGRELGGQGWWW